MFHRVYHSLHHLRRLVFIKIWRFFRSHPVLQSETLLLLTIMLSLACGGVAVLLHHSIELVHHTLQELLRASHGNSHLILLILTPALGGLLAGLILQYIVPAARGSGIPQVKLDLLMHSGVIPLKVAIGKFITTSLAVGSGGSVGREGPTVQICASLGSRIARWFPTTPTQVRTLVHAACVSGVAAAFNTPIAGMTFVMEEIIGDLNARHLSYLLYAAVGAVLMTRFFQGDVPVFDVPAYELHHPGELLLYLVLGLCAGMLSVGFIRALVWSIARFQKLTMPEYLKPACGGLAIGVMSLALPQVLGMGYGVVTDAMQNRLPINLLLILTLAKFAATIISYSSGTAGGLFAPSLFIGAMLGGSVAALCNAFPGITIHSPGAFALVGMGAVFAGIIRTPLTSILMIFEMTNDYAIILPLMLANMTSYALARFLEPHNVYEAILAINHIHLPSSRDYDVLEDITAGAVMTRHPMTILPNMSLTEGAAMFARSPYQEIPVVDTAQHFLGVIYRADVRRYITAGNSEKPVMDILVKEGVLFAHVDHSLHLIMQRLGEQDQSLMPIVTHGHAPRLLGVVTRATILRTFARHKAEV